MMLRKLGILSFFVAASISWAFCAYAADSSDPVALNDSALLTKWESILRGEQQNKIPWYRAYSDFVALSYRGADKANSPFLENMIETTARTRKGLIHDFCIAGPCQVHVNRKRLTEMLTIIGDYRKQINSPMYDHIYTCSTFFRASQYASKGRRIYQTMDDVIGICKHEDGKKDTRQCEVNVVCDAPGFNPVMYECTTFSRESNYSFLTRDPDFGRQKVADDCASNTGSIADFCKRNAQCVQIKTAQ